MKKIVRQQNYFKEMIDSQSNQPMTRQTLKCLIRSVVEPLLDDPESGVVFHRIDNREGLQGLLKRLEFSEVEAIDYSDNSGNLVEKVWANTEFVCVLTHRFVAIIIWDNNTGDKNLVRYYSLYNSKLQYEPLNIIKRNSKVDITPYQEKYNPDRRDNILLNASIRRLLNILEDAASDAVLGYAEKSVETLVDSDYIQKKTRVVAHEIRNHLSICDLYNEIISRYANEGNIEGIKNATKLIDKALKMTNNSLISLKTEEKSDLQKLDLSEVVENAAELSRVYLLDKNIELQIEKECVYANVDAEKLTAVIINLVKNASEAFELVEVQEDGKYIKIKIDKDENTALIMVSNNGAGITEPEKIFNEGFTTKTSGSGLGLWICKKSIEEQNGELELTRSTEDYTEFTIKLGKEE